MSRPILADADVQVLSDGAKWLISLISSRVMAICRPESRIRGVYFGAYSSYVAIGVITSNAASPASSCITVAAMRACSVQNSPGDAASHAPVLHGLFIPDIYIQHQTGLPISSWRMQQFQLSEGSCIEADDASSRGFRAAERETGGAK